MIHVLIMVVISTTPSTPSAHGKAKTEIIASLEFPNVNTAIKKLRMVYGMPDTVKIYPDDTATMIDFVSVEDGQRTLAQITEVTK